MSQKMGEAKDRIIFEKKKLFRYVDVETEIIPEEDDYSDYDSKETMLKDVNNLIMALDWLYESEINYHISTFWDGGIDVKLGDEMNGFLATGTVRSLKEAIIWLAVNAKEHYPGSVFSETVEIRK